MSRRKRGARGLANGSGWLPAAVGSALMKWNGMYTRRAWIGAVAGVALGVAGFVRLFPYLRQRAIKFVYQGESGEPAVLPPGGLRIVAEFTGALMGRRMNEEQVELLSKRLAFAARTREGEYAALVKFVNDQARRIDPNLKSFSDASDDVREQIVQKTMKEPARSRVARIALLTSADNRSRLRIRHGTARHLRFVYSRSPVPWLLRGYKGVPGAPVDRLEYTRPGPTLFG